MEQSWHLSEMVVMMVSSDPVADMVVLVMVADAMGAYSMKGRPNASDAVA